MIRIEFENASGRIAMEGGTHTSMNITSLSGFGIPAREMSSASFAGQAGITTTAIKDIQRIMTIGGDFWGNPKEIEKIYRILYDKGTLTCYFGNEKRQITCFATNNDEFVEQGKSGLYKFALQFQADNPYFTDTEQKAYPIYKREDLITGSFTLPAVFTQRTTMASVVVDGDRPVYPQINIISFSEAADGGALIIRNNSTGSFIVLNHHLKNGEEIVIDIPNRKIQSNTDGIITNQISDETVLSNFLLVEGTNDISVEKTNADDVFYAEITYKNLYITAVY